jgi:hypothetical protein
MTLEWIKNWKANLKKLKGCLLIWEGDEEEIKGLRESVLMADESYGRRLGREAIKRWRTTMKPGDILKFKNPMPDEDPDERYILIDDPKTEGERVNVTPVSLQNWPIPPIMRHNIDEMEIA